MAYQLDTATASPTPPAVGTVGTPGYPTNGNPAATPPVPASIADAYFDYANNAEICNFVTATGVVLAKANVTQMVQSAKRLAAANSEAFAGTALTADNAGLVTVNVSSGNESIQLPAAAAANGVPIRYKFARIDASANTATLNAAGTDTIEFHGASMLIPQLATVDLMSDGSGTWYPQISGDPLAGGSSNSSGSATALSTTVSFTIQQDCKIHVTGNCGGTAGVLSLGMTTYSGATLGAQSANWSGGSGQGIGAYSGVFSASAGATVSFTLSMTCGSAGSVNIGLQYLMVPYV